MVEPVVHSLLADDELEGPEVTWGPPPGYVASLADDADEVWVRLSAAGQEFAARVMRATIDLWDAGSVAADLADALKNRTDT